MTEPVMTFFQGVGWVGATFWAALFTLLGVIVRAVGPWRKLSIEAEQKLRDDLLRRVEKLERELDRKEIRHQAERASDRHRLNNVTQCFDALILMLEVAQDPDQVKAIIGRVKEMRARQVETEALEKAAIHAAAIADSEERDVERRAEGRTARSE